MRHVYLSPHLDDAVLSCGGAIHRQAAAGEPVWVITLLTGEAAAPFSDFALVQHGYWGDPPRPMALRRAEDAAALTLLRADWYHAGYPDAVYRATPDGAWLYDGLERLFGEPDARDPLALAVPELAAELGGFAPRDEATVYAPLGVGGHVDHRIAHAAARRLAERGYQVAFYEDYPYAAQPGAVEARLAALRSEPAEASVEWRSEPVDLDAADVGAWVSAVSYYRTQLGILFRGAEAMPGQVWAFATAGVRLWWPPHPS